MVTVEEKPFTISVGPANIRDRAMAREFECYLRENLPTGVVIREQRHQPGVIIANAVDIHVLLADGSALVTIAGLVWSLYKHFVEKHRKEKGEGFVLMSIQYNRSVVRMHRIGDDITTEEQLHESVQIIQRAVGSQKRDGGRDE